MKRLNELEKELQASYNQSTNLSGEVEDVRKDLAENTQADEKLEARVQVIEETGGGGGELASDDDINNLFE